MCKWEEMYYYADFDWPVLFKVAYKVARETDVQSLQFKLINTYSNFMGLVHNLMKLLQNNVPTVWCTTP